MVEPTTSAIGGRGRLSERELEAAIRVASGAMRQSNFRFAVVALAGLLAGVLLAVPRTRNWWELAFAIAMALIFIWFLRNAPIRAARRAIRKGVDLRSEIEIQVTPVAVSFKSPVGLVEIPWDSFSKVQVQDDLVLLYTQENVYNVVPRSWFGSSDWQSFLALARRRLVA
jgi:hypothetical protein